jgi:glycosyltransferase involved in cell wall biosynthesis
VRLGAVYISEQINAFYRMYLPMMAMIERGHQVVEVLQERGTALPVEQLADCDLVHIHRLLLTADDDDCVARLKDAGAAVGFDDDDITEAAPDELGAFIAEGSLPRAKRDFARLIARAPAVDLVTTPSLHLAERFEAAGARNVHVIDNHLPGAFSRVEPRGHDGLVVGWHAASEHRLDVEALGLRDVFLALLRAHRDLRVVTIGIDLELDHERYAREDYVAIAGLTQRLADFDIGIVPLADTPFNRGRSNVKAREYAAAGVPWLASPVGPYARLGRAEGGVLVGDDGWFDALDGLLRGRRERRKLAKHARAWAARETIWRMAGVWEDVFRNAIDGARAAA